jgi:hypothetical protein
VIVVLDFFYYECNCFLSFGFLLWSSLKWPKIRKAGISGDSSDNESFDVVSENKDVEDRPWRPSRVVFEKSTVKQGKIEEMKCKYFHEISIVRAGGESIVHLPEADEVVVFKSFMKAGLHFPLHKMLVEVLKTFEIYLQQLTPEALIKLEFLFGPWGSKGWS